MGISIYNTPLSERQHKEYLRLLESCGLRDEGDADIVALMTEDDDLIACGALAGHAATQHHPGPFQPTAAVTFTENAHTSSNSMGFGYKQSVRHSVCKCVPELF